MSILIQGMEMPDDCYSCPFRELEDRDTDICFITGERFSALFTLNQQKNADCPLIEIPPHGRLIDADEFEQVLEKAKAHASDRGMLELARKYEIFRFRLEKQPTVIPADKEGHDG